MRIAILHSISGASVDGTETASVMSSTFSLGDPIAVDSLDNNQNRPVTEQFSEVVKSFKQTTIDHEQFDSQESAHPQPLVAAVESPAQLSGANTADIPDPSPEDSLLLCLFCNYRSPTTPLNVGHMSKIHGMFIPEQSYLTDVKGLIEYLSRKIDVIHECLYCGKWKNSKTGIQTHMRDKGHCMIAFDTEEAMIEVGQFYDFSSTYSGSEDDDERGDGVDEEPTTRQGSKVDGDVEDGEGWETDSSASSLDSNDLTAVPLDNSHRLQRLDRHAHHSRQDPRPHHNKDGWHSHAHHHPHAVYHSDFELHLPSGRTAGHRSLARYYRQNLHNYPTATERLERAAIMHDRQSDSDDDERTGRHSRGRQGQMITRANGGTGMIGVTDAKKREVQAVEKREMKRSQREQGRNQWKVDKQGNSQKQFRVRLLPFQLSIL